MESVTRQERGMKVSRRFSLAVFTHRRWRAKAFEGGL